MIYTGDDDYEQMMAEFVATSADAGVRPTGAEYELWAADRPVPSLAAVRLHFHTWTKAVQAGLSRSGRGLPRRGAGRPTLEADRLVMLQTEQLDRLMSAASARLAPAPPPREANRVIKEVVRDLTGDMVRAFESFRRRWLLAAIREDTGPFEARFGVEGRGSKEERRAWEAARHRPAREIVEEVLEPRSLDGLLSAAKGDLRNDSGWLAMEQRDRLLAIDPSESPRWRVLKAARNCLQHGEGPALRDLARALAELDPNSDAQLVVSGNPPESEANILRWLAADVGAPPGYDPGPRLHRSRLAHLHGMLRRVTVAMYSKGSAGPDLAEASASLDEMGADGSEDTALNH